MIKLNPFSFSYFHAYWAFSFFFSSRDSPASRNHVSFLVFCILQKEALLEALTYLLSTSVISFFLSAQCDNGQLKLLRSKNHHRPRGINSIISLQMRSLFLASSFAHYRACICLWWSVFSPFFSVVQKRMIFSPRIFLWSVRPSLCISHILLFLFLPMLRFCIYIL